MYPANRYMDPYHLHYRNHTPYPYYSPPAWETPYGHPWAMDSSYYRPPSCGTWPYNHDMHNSHPSVFHCCCNQTYPPDYYRFRPPLPQELPPPHLYYHGPFPQHLNACPPLGPSHPYPVDHTPYGYDKFKSHCCGCPNHVCPGAEKSNVKIEEERPDVKLESEHKNADSGSIIQHPNNKYPFIWLPAGNMKGKENGEHYELSPHFLNEWAPVSSKKSGDVKQQEQDNQKGKQFQWPIVWMPAGYEAPNQKAKGMNNTGETPKSPKISEEASQSPKIKIIPLSWFENGHHHNDHDQKPAAKNGSGDHNRSAVKNQPVVMPKSVNDEKNPLKENCETIPAVPEKEINEKKASTYRTIPVMKESDVKKIDMREKKEAKEANSAEKVDNSAEKVEEKRKTKHSDSSVAKHSKLPPVCLRVDPLPRKKSGNGSSRSPSPPRKDADNAKEDMKEAQSQNLEAKQSGTSKHITVSNVKEKPPYEMNEEIGFNNETGQAASVEHSQEEEASTSKDDQKVQDGSTIISAQKNLGEKSCSVQENVGAGSLNGWDKTKNEDEMAIGSEAAKDCARTFRVNLSESDAAIRIQSAYRGYDVRRWQPLDKLRKIRDVHEQMQGVKKQLQCLEDSCNKPTQKEQVAIGETVMNLLLKLDTIQGLHRSVREARKSVARELICLQERLDTLCKAPSGGLNHTNSNDDDDESEGTKNVIQTAAPTVTTEDSDRQVRAADLRKIGEQSSVNYMDPCSPVPSGVSWEVMPDAGANEKNEKQELCSTTMDEVPEEGKAEGQIELQVASSMDMISDEASTEHPTANQENNIGPSNVNSVEQVTEQEKPTSEDEVKESPLVNSVAPLYDSASSGDSSGLKQYAASTDQNLYAESNTGCSPASTEDINISAPTASVESEVETEKDGPLDSHMHETAALENVELKDDVSSAESQHSKSSSPVVQLEDPLVPLKDVEQHGLIPAEDFVVSNTEEQEARDVGLQVPAVDSMQDSGEVPDGTREASTNDDLELGTSADVEKHDQLSLLEPTLDSNSAPELSVLDESHDKMHCGVPGKDEVPHVDEKTETTVDKVTGGSANCEDLLCESSGKGPDIKESHPSLGEVADNTTGGSVFPDSDSCDLSCPHDGGIIVYEEPEMVSSENQTDAQKEKIYSDVSETNECTKTQKAAPVGTDGDNSAKDSDVLVSEMDKCNEMPKEAPAHPTGANPAEDEASLKEDMSVQTENKASACPAPGDPKVRDEERLAEENQKLKELLQKLLASGNDQMGVITDLNEKVKALEQKLARKKRPKVRVHRPSRHATAKVH